MPIYEYRCPACERRFEKLMRMSASSPACPDCGHEEVVKLVSGAGFILKGGGWYRDHYGLKKSGADGGGESADAPKGDGGSSDSGGSGSETTTTTGSDKT